MMLFLPLFTVIFILAGSASASFLFHKDNLYEQYCKRYNYKVGDEASVMDFLANFLRSLYQPVEKIDALLTKDKWFENLKAKRGEYRLLCKNADPRSFGWFGKEFASICAVDKVKDETMLAVWEAFRKLPCASLVDYDPDVFLKTFQKVYGVKEQESSRNKSPELLELYENKLAEAINKLGYDKALSNQVGDKIMLAVEAWNSGFLNASLEDKVKRIEDFIDNATFNPKSAFNRIKQLQQARNELRAQVKQQQEEALKVKQLEEETLKLKQIEEETLKLKQIEEEALRVKQLEEENLRLKQLEEEKMKLKQQQEEALKVSEMAKKFEEGPPEKHNWKSALQLYVDYAKRWQPSSHQNLCVNVPNRLLVDFFRQVVTSFHSHLHELVEVEPRLSGLRWFRNEKEARELNPFDESQVGHGKFVEDFCNIVGKLDVALFEKINMLYVNFFRIPTITTKYVTDDHAHIRMAYGDAVL